MATKVIDNPDWQGWTEEDQKDFIVDAKKWVQERGNYPSKQAVQDWLYKVGCDWGMLRICKEEFIHRLNDTSYPPRPPMRRNYYGRWMPSCRGSEGRDFNPWTYQKTGGYRVGKKYRKCPDHQPREKLTNKKCWRIEKKMNKDKARPTYSRRHWRDRDRDNSRGWAKQQLAKGDWENVVWDG